MGIWGFSTTDTARMMMGGNCWKVGGVRAERGVGKRDEEEVEEGRVEIV